MALTDIKIGDRFWVWDAAFTKFREVEIFGETSRSWLYGAKWRPSKAPKSKPFSVFFTREMIDLDEWVSNNRYLIARMVELQSHDVLRKVAEIIGYVEPKS